MVFKARVVTQEGEGFRPSKFEEEVKIDKLKLKNLRLAAKVCDGSLHPVYSEIDEILKKQKNMLKLNPLSIMPKIAPDSEIHGKRFVLYYDPKQNKTFLLGDVFSTLKSLNRNLKF